MSESVTPIAQTPIEYLTPGEVAEIYKVAERTVYRWIENGELRHIRIGGTVRIPKSAIAELDKEAS